MTLGAINLLYFFTPFIFLVFIFGFSVGELYTKNKIKEKLKLGWLSVDDNLYYVNEQYVANNKLRNKGEKNVPA
jgi:uncharacterized protein YebE (UPF0316 family)